MDQVRRENTIIVGAGPIGLACALSARRRGIDPLVIDAGAVVDAITRYPIGMTFFTTPELLEIGGHPLVCAAAKPTREEALKYYRGIVRTERLRVRTYTRLITAQRNDTGFAVDVATDRRSERWTCERIVLATGYFDHPRPFPVPGAELPHVYRYFDEAHRSYGLDVVVVGGKNSAVEAALDLYRAGARTTLVYRGPTFKPSVKYWIKPDIENRIAAGEIAAHLHCDVVRIEPDAVIVRPRDAGAEVRVAAQRVYVLIGFQPDVDLFRRLGIEIDPDSGRPTIDADTLETNVPGLYMAGSITRGYAISDVFIENGRFDGERVFGPG